jgi:hypothetical protein
VPLVPFKGIKQRSCTKRSNCVPSVQAVCIRGGQYAVRQASNAYCGRNAGNVESTSPSCAWSVQLLIRKGFRRSNYTAVICSLLRQHNKSSQSTLAQTVKLLVGSSVGDLVVLFSHPRTNKRYNFAFGSVWV